LLRVGVHASRYTSTPRIAAQVHMLLAARRARAGLLPHPAEEIAAIPADLVDVVPSAADHAVERVRYPRGTEDGSVDAIREALPAGERSRRTAHLRRRVDRVARAAARKHKDGR